MALLVEERKTGVPVDVAGNFGHRYQSLYQRKRL